MTIEVLFEYSLSAIKKTAFADLALEGRFDDIREPIVVRLINQHLPNELHDTPDGESQENQAIKRIKIQSHGLTLPSLKGLERMEHTLPLILATSA